MTSTATRADGAPAVSSLRDRRRAAATAEILDAAERQITERGPAALSLRAVARDLGMTVQALYHYFPNRAALVTSLITKTYDDLAHAVQTAIDEAPDGAELPGLVVAAEAYRGWAVAHPERFQLIYGTPLRDYAAPEEGPTTKATRRLSAIFQRELFAGYTTAQLAAARTPELSPTLLADFAHLAPADGPNSLPAPAIALMLSAWGHMHGLVTLEVFGHTSFIGDHQAEIFRMSMHSLAADIRRRID
ncbi:TetR/AcrR family transcriptional regulator [Streptomyces triticagri]|uniref:TetR/AcrR family transcriptional regulator n=1 Tax=Streptomyces triticagri TaxID=2293568 RepID=A0A372M996_9ACTN|nr:TetR/AcrR family transcriptional regulator [Streptomyces triticagri]RFU87522.1 TetR/AcrR family transcriptional regulator [Streptomyces triticagri]